MMKLKDVRVNVKSYLNEKIALVANSLDGKYSFHVWVTLPDLHLASDEVIHRRGKGTGKYRAISQASDLGKSVVEAMFWHVDYLDLKKSAVTQSEAYIKRQDETKAKREKTKKEKETTQNWLIFIAKTMRTYSGDDPGLLKLKEIAHSTLQRMGQQ